ncbi:MAG: DUF2497 domain-containing protein [Proteobacteria bacterium]|nr:DUF2497 domain-containing protein [Pseudomonadota bacterium]
MAEKNTLSILESIKQKMAKFDEKGQKSITAFDNDFDYPSSHGNETKQEAATEMNVENKPNMNLIHDKKEDDDKINNNDFLFEHEDEGKKDFLHEEDLDLEDEFEEEFEEEEEESVVENKKEPQPVIEDIDDEDFILNKAEAVAKKPEAKQEEEDHGLDLDLEDDDFDIEEDNHQETQMKQEAKPAPVKQEMKPEVKPAEVKQEMKSNTIEEDDDLDVDFEEFEEDEKKPEALQKQVVEEVEEEDEDFEDDEFEFEEEKKLKELEKPQAKVEDKAKMVEPEEEDEDFVGIDLDIEDNTSSQKSDQAMQVKPVNYSQNVNIPIQTMPVEMNNTISAIPSRKAPSPSRPLLHEDTLQQTTGSIKKLMEANNVVQGIKAFTDKNDSSLNELAVQLMESRLERWLNDHLPDLVEKIVREEIKKIIPKE